MLKNFQNIFVELLSLNLEDGLKLSYSNSIVLKFFPIHKSDLFNFGNNNAFGIILSSFLFLIKYHEINLPTASDISLTDIPLLITEFLVILATSKIIKEKRVIIYLSFIN